MNKTGLHLASIGLILLLAVGCTSYSFGYGVQPAQPGGPPPNVPPTPPVPVISLQQSGAQVAGLKTIYSWTTGNSAGSGGYGYAWPPAFPATLNGRVGQSIDILVGYPAPPKVLWVAELDSQGTLATAIALTPISTLTPYPLAHSGQYVLQVMAQWTHQDYVAYLFALNVQP